MTRIDGSGERLGAVAGWADGTVSGNYYLQEKAVGIDGIDYAGQTAPLSFGAFSALEAFRRTFSPSASPSRPGSGGGHSGGALRRPGPRRLPGSTQRRRALWRLGSL
ncbi:MAG: hypothetical protein ACLRWQ_07050 [Flavonifractor plautii]